MKKSLILCSIPFLLMACGNSSNPDGVIFDGEMNEAIYNTDVRNSYRTLKLDNDNFTLVRAAKTKNGIYFYLEQMTTNNDSLGSEITDNSFNFRVRLNGDNFIYSSAYKRVSNLTTYFMSDVLTLGTNRFYAIYEMYISYSHSECHYTYEDDIVADFGITIITKEEETKKNYISCEFFDSEGKKTDKAMKITSLGFENL